MTGATDQQGRLGFLDAVRAAFNFLFRAGFREVRAESTFIRFESGRVFVQVFHGRQSYALGVELGRLAVDSEIYSLPEAVAALCPERVAEARFQSSTVEGTRKGLAAIGRLVLGCCARLIAGDDDAFALLHEKASVRRRELTLVAQYGAVRDRANRAWEERNFAEALRLYTEMEEALTDSESRRIRHLQRKFSSKMG